VICLLCAALLYMADWCDTERNCGKVAFCGRNALNSGRTSDMWDAGGVRDSDWACTIHCTEENFLVLRNDWYVADWCATRSENARESGFFDRNAFDSGRESDMWDFGGIRDSDLARAIPCKKTNILVLGSMGRRATERPVR
jgi:hypothetical protein